MAAEAGADRGEGVGHDPTNAMGLLISFVLGAIVLGAGQWLVVFVADWVQRRKRRLGRRLNIVVLVDRSRRSRRRQCFWRFVLRSSAHDFRHRFKFRLLSIADQLAKGRNPATLLFSPERTDIIIVNWDAINGDPVYGSDLAYRFMEHYSPDMCEWLTQGGVVIVESQGASWSSSDSAYSCFTRMFEGSRVRLRSEMWTLGDSAIVHEAQTENALVSGLEPDALKLAPGGLWARRSWFPRHLLRSDVQSLRFARRHQQLLYRGWFDEWSDDWKSILAPDVVDVAGPVQAGSGRRAIALYRKVHRPKESGRPIPDTGYVVLTTMFLASAELYGLISNLLGLATQARDGG
jgi:hypothetical protein